MPHTYCVIGAGRQGVATAYDLARLGDAGQVILADLDLAAATRAAERVNRLTGGTTAVARRIDVTDQAAVRELLEPVAVCCSAVPFPHNLALTKAAIESRTSFCDLGGNSDVVWSQLELDEAARKAGVSVVPDCGVGPGMISNLAVHAIQQLDEARHVRIYDGGLPQSPRPPFNYALFFNVGGLTNEYLGNAQYIVDGQLREVPTFDDSEYELVDVPQLGRLEAFVTSGALTTMSRTYRGKLHTLKNKTLRYPGHVAVLKGIHDLGLMDAEPVPVNGGAVSPRDVLHHVLDRAFAPRDDDRDLMVIHMLVDGEKDGKPARVTLDLLDRHHEETGFAAMERTTGFHMAIVAAMQASGEIAPGATPLEVAVPAARMVEELERRDMAPQVRVEPLS